MSFMYMFSMIFMSNQISTGMYLYKIMACRDHMIVNKCPHVLFAANGMADNWMDVYCVMVCICFVAFRHCIDRDLFVSTYM